MGILPSSAPAVLLPTPHHGLWPQTDAWLPASTSVLVSCWLKPQGAVIPASCQQVPRARATLSGVYRQDGFPGCAVLRWPFLQSMLHFLVHVLSFERNIFTKRPQYCLKLVSEQWNKIEDLLIYQHPYSHLIFWQSTQEYLFEKRYYLQKTMLVKSYGFEEE